MSAKVESWGRPQPSKDEMAAANQLLRILTAQASKGDAKLRVIGEECTAEIALSRSLSDLLIDLLDQIGRGHAVTLVPVDQMLTIQQAAEILNVSRAYLAFLLDADKIQHTRVGRHRRIRAENLLAFKKTRDEKRSKALGALAEMDAALL